MPIKYPEAESELTPAPFIRRVVAILYDSLIVVALLMVTTGFYKMIQAGVLGTEELKRMTEAGQLNTDPLLSSVLFLVLYFFFGYFWTKSGQTLGMQVWHIRIQTSEGLSITWMQALLRFFMAGISIAAFGLGYFWMFFDKKKRTWQDIFSMTETVRIPKRKAE